MTVDVKLPPRPSVAGADSDAPSTDRDHDVDDVVGDEYLELSLAQRMCPSTLEIAAERDEKVRCS